MERETEPSFNNEKKKDGDQVEKQILNNFHRILNNVHTAEIRWKDENHEKMAQAVVGQPNFGSELKEGQIPAAVAIVFPPDPFLRNRKIGMAPTSPEIIGYCEKYFEIIQKIQSINQRELGPEQQHKLRESLDNQRKFIHDKVAESVIGFYAGYRVSVKLPEARLLAQALMDIWSLETYSAGINFSDNFGKLNLKSLQDEIKGKFDLALSYQRDAHSYHDMEPIYYYSITLKGPQVKVKEAQVIKFIEEKLSIVGE